ncbi:hypothetical protein BKA82DRAFT_4186092 [Pisolithus tinctorius]|nr:hypothetical protein BKA82DRAFT_4186092 [Pisolithus tinctorius]
MGVTFKTLVLSSKPNNAAALFVSMAVIGSCCMTILPLAIELGIELTRNANGSSAILWCSGNLFGIILIWVMEGALRAPSTADPPYNMRDALILHGCVVMQARREVDEAMIRATVLGTVNAGGVGWSHKTSMPVLEMSVDPTNIAEDKQIHYIP